MSTFARTLWLPLLIAVAACCWLLPSLGNGMLWEDEAQTALLGRTTLQHGVPVAFDGPNSISQEKGDDYGYHRLWKWHMWLPFYVLAGFFKVFGESTAIARLPFALFGVATVVLTYFTALSIWRDPKSAVLSAVLVLLCIPFALLARQCRYYSPAMFFSLLMLHEYLRICRGARRGWITLAIAAISLFNSHFIYCATTFAAIGLHAIIWHRGQLKSLLFAGVTTAVICAAPLVWVSGITYRNYPYVFTWHYAMYQVVVYATDIFIHIVPYPLVLIPIAVCVKAAITRKRILPSLASLEPWALPIFLTVIMLMMVGPFTPSPFFRYMGPAIAPLLILVARWVVLAFRTQIVLGIATTVLLGVWWPVSPYVYELRHRFVGPLEGIVEFLNSHANPADVVVVSYEDLPIKFYTKLRVLGGNTGEDIAAAKGSRWLVLRNLSGQAVREFINNQVKQNPKYKRITLNVPDTEFENREEPDQHYYRSVKNAARVVIYELQKP
jgi:Dolichyl-phosphate-mannose-protein mannosyltransferase